MLDASSTKDIAGTATLIGSSSAATIVLYNIAMKVLDLFKIKILNMKSKNKDISVTLANSGLERQESKLSKKVEKTEVELMMARQKESCMDKVDKKLDTMKSDLIDEIRGIHRRLDSVIKNKQRYGD